MARPRRGQLKQVRIEALDPRGPGLATVAGVAVRVPDTAPGDLVRVRLGKRGHSGWFGELVELLTPGPERREPPCPLAGRCGGCTWQHVEPALQQRTRLAHGQQLLSECARLKDLKVEAYPLPAGRELGYRHRVKLPIEAGPRGLRLGCYAAHSHEVVEAERCLVHAALLDRLLSAVKDVLGAHRWPAGDTELGQAALRTVFARVNGAQDQALLGFATRSELDLSPLWGPLRAKVPELVGLFRSRAADAGNSLLAREIVSVCGRTFIDEQLGPVRMRIPAGAFSQVDPHAASCIADLIAEQMRAAEPRRVLDLYCGLGALGIRAALGTDVPLLQIERDPAMAEEAGRNARLNGLQSESFAGNVADWQGRLQASDGVIVNPPRKGLEPDLLQRLCTGRPARIAYLSCRPETLARDLDALVAAGARVERLVGFDLFPQTVHIETLALLRFDGDRTPLRG